jgi:enoyl-CoA hydratase/carnithine racemase
MEWARDIADHCSPTAMASIKGQLLRVSGQTLPQAVDESLAMMRVSFGLPDLAEALAAKGDKRATAFAPRQA